MLPQARLALLALAVLVARPSQALLSHKPFSAWRTLENSHFQLVYPPELEAEAPRVLAQAEAEYARLAQLFGSEPHSRIDLILADESDDANGYATMYPSARLGLVLAPPDDPPELADLEDWTRRLLAHELTHVFQFETTHGLPRFLGAVFGRFPLFYPALFQPAWVHEGLATWSETDTEKYWGRGQDAYYKGLMRVELAGKFKTLRHVNQPLRQWPGGTTRYLYGVYFTQFLEKQFGREKVSRWVSDYNDDFFPFFINRNAKRHFGKKLPKLWKEFESELRQRWIPDFAALSATAWVGKPVPEKFKAQGYRSYPPRSNSHGELFTILDDGQRPARLARLAPGEQWDELTVVSTRRYAIDDVRGRVLLVERDWKEQAGPTARLVAFDLKTRRRKSLGCLKGLRDIAAMPDGVAAIFWRQGKYQLVKLDQVGNEIEILWQASQREVLAGLSLAPDGKNIVSAMWQASEGWDIRSFDLEKKIWSDLAAGSANEIQPQYGSDGLLYFSSDQGGVYNIWRSQGDGKKLERLTHVLGGAFHPAPGKNAILYFSTLTQDGYALATAPLGPGLKEALTLSAPRQRPRREVSPKDANYERGTYSAFLNAVPAYWLPVPTGSFSDENHSVGLMLQGEDLLERHEYELSIALNRYSALGPAYETRYRYKRFWPQFSTGFNRDTSGESYGAGYLTHRAWLGIDLPWSSTWRRYGLAYFESVYREQKIDMATHWGQEMGTAYESRWRSAEARYDSSRSFPQALKNVDGWQLQIWAAQRENPDLDELSYAYASASYPLGLGRGGVFTLSGSYESMLQGPYTFGFDSFRSGFANVNDYGRVVAQGRLDWSFLLWNVERGIMAPPMGLDRIHASLALSSIAFGDGESATFGTPWTSAEARLNIDWMLGYAVPLPTSIGVRRGVGMLADWHVFMSVSIKPARLFEKSQRPASFDKQGALLRSLPK